MATSGSTDFTVTRDQIITRALEIVKAVSPGDTPDATKVTRASEYLNGLVKSWQSLGIFLWTLDWVTKTFTASSQVTGTDGNIYTCIRSHTSAASNRPVTGADWSTYWELAGTTGGGWITATPYSAIGDFDVATDTIGIEKAFLRRANADTPINIVTSADYMDISDKTAVGRTHTLWFQNKLAPHIYLYPQPDLTTDVLHYMRIRRLEDFDASTDNPDFPVKWIEALEYGLADKLSVVYGLPLNERRDIRNEANILRMIAKGDDNEQSSNMSISPQMRR